MLSVEEALEAVGREVEPVDVERIDVGRAAGRVAAEALDAAAPVPPFRQSAMDGYAVELDAGGEGGRRLVGESAAGAREMPPEPGPEGAVRVRTGAPVSRGADAVVRQEDVDRREDEIVMSAEPDEGANIRPAGEELREGERLVGAGSRIRPTDAAALALAGRSAATVRRAPRIAVVVTGDEIVAPGEPAPEYAVPDANGTLLRARLARRRPAEPALHRVGDDMEALTDLLVELRETVDLIVTSGGVSVGDRDFVRPASQSAGFEEVFWGVAQKPGKPVYFARSAGAALLGMPGTPGAAVVASAVYLARAVDALEGVRRPAPHFETGVLDEPVGAKSSRTRWIGARIRRTDEGVTKLRPVEGRHAHHLGTLRRGDALMRIPPADTDHIDAGSAVPFVDLSGTEIHPSPT